MLFRRSFEDDRRVWVDRGIDARLDDFEVCEPCADSLNDRDPGGRHWHDGDDLCPECRTDLAARLLAVDLLGLSRPFNGMIEGRVITNDELDAAPRLSVPGAFDYFLPELGDAFEPGSGDRFLPSREDGFGPDPGDRFMPGSGDAFRPDLDARSMPSEGDAFRPDLYARFMPGEGDAFLPDPDDCYLLEADEYFQE